MADAEAFGLFTLGVNSGGDVGLRLLRGRRDRPAARTGEPENRAPVIVPRRRRPTIGFAPLPVDFTSTATDADRRPADLQLGLRRRRHADSTSENPSHTYTTPGDLRRQGDRVRRRGRRRSRTVTVQVLGRTTPRRGSGCSSSPRRRASGTTRSTRGIAAIEQLGAANDFQVDHTEDATAFRDAVLANYDAVVFLSTTGDVLNDTQQAAFERYIQAGGGYAGIHAAADTEYDWNWYGQLVGAYFRSHPPGRRPRRSSSSRTPTPLDAGPPEPAGRDRRVVQLPSPVTTRARASGGRGLQPAGGRPRARHARRVDLRRGGRQRRRTTTIRSRGASATTVAARGTRAWATPRPRSPRPTSSSTSSAASVTAGRRGDSRASRPAARGPARGHRRLLVGRCRPWRDRAVGLAACYDPGRTGPAGDGDGTSGLVGEPAAPYGARDAPPASFEAVTIPTASSATGDSAMTGRVGPQQTGAAQVTRPGDPVVRAGRRWPGVRRPADPTGTAGRARALLAVTPRSTGFGDGGTCLPPRTRTPTRRRHRDGTVTDCAAQPPTVVVTVGNRAPTVPPAASPTSGRGAERDVATGSDSGRAMPCGSTSHRRGRRAAAGRTTGPRGRPLHRHPSPRSRRRRPDHTWLTSITVTRP